MCRGATNQDVVVRSTEQRVVSFSTDEEVATGVAFESATEAQLKELGLAFPKLSISLTVQVPGGKDSFVRKLAIAQPPPAKGSVTVKTYAKRDDAPTVFELDGAIVKDLGKELFELQDKSVFKFDREAVRTMVFETPGKDTVRVARSKEALGDGGVGEEKFEVTAPTAGPAKKWKLSGNLQALLNLKAAAFGEPVPKDAKALAKLGLDKPRVVTLLGEKDAVLARLAVGSDNVEKKRTWAHAEGSPKVIELESVTVADLAWAATDALDNPPPPPPPPPSPLPMTPMPQSTPVPPKAPGKP